MRHPCRLCDLLERHGVNYPAADPVPWMDSLPPEAGQLESFAPGSGHAGTVQLRRCTQCGQLYRYRYHSEYDVSGSWDEYYLWKLSDAAQPRVAAILMATSEAKAALLADALQDPCADLREDASLLLWIFTDAGEAYSLPLLRAAVHTLSDEVFLAGNYAYRALLSFGHRGADSAKLLLEALRKPERISPSDSFTGILVREFERQ